MMENNENSPKQRTIKILAMSDTHDLHKNLDISTLP